VAGSVKLARWICVKESFRDLRFGSFGEMPTHRAASYMFVLSHTDILLEAFTQDFLKSEIQIYHGPKREIHLAFQFDSESPTTSALPITVQDYSNQNSESDRLFHTMAVDRTNFKHVPSDRYAIIPGGVPSLDDLLNCVQADLVPIGGQSVKRLFAALMEFMDRYCENELQLPLVSFTSSPRFVAY